MFKPTWVVATLAALLAGCAAHATQSQLINRAAFDLQCDADAISVVEIDDLTRGARGCGRQATYVEICDGAKNGGNSSQTKCTWVMNTANKTEPAAPTP